MSDSIGGEVFSSHHEPDYLCWMRYSGVPPGVPEVRYAAFRVLGRPLPEDVVLVPQTEGGQLVLWACQREPSPHVPVAIRHLDFPDGSADDAQPSSDTA